MASGVAEATKAGRDAEASILNENAKREADIRNLRLQGLASRADVEAGLTSDEIASIRNMDFAERQLNLEKLQLEQERLLGERALALQQGNIEAAERIAKQQSRNQLLMSGLGIFAAGGGFGMFGGGSGGGGGFNPFGKFGSGGAQGPLLPNGQFATGSPGFFGGMSPFGKLALGAGAAFATDRLLDANLGQKLKSVATPFFRPDQTVKQISKGVKKIFPF